MDFGKALSENEKKKKPEYAKVSEKMSLTPKDNSFAKDEPVTSKTNYRAPVDVTEEAYAYFRDAYKSDKSEGRKKQFVDFLKKNPKYLYGKKIDEIK